MAKTKINLGYAAYQFRKGEQDPIVDRLRTIFEDHSGDVTKTAEASGVSTGTIHNWWNGKTKRPQFCTAAAVARSMGYDFVLAPTNGHASVSAATTGQILKRFPSARDIVRTAKNGTVHHVNE